MPGLAAWKLAIPLGALAVSGLILMRPHRIGGELTSSAVASASATLGYLTPREMPDAVALLPPPPQPGSAAMGRDEEARDAALRLKGGPRYALATADANRDQSNTVAAFQCAFGTEISKASTPDLYRLLSRLRLDVRAAAYPAKSYFKRPRPFVANNTRACYVADEQNVRDDGSYPSARGAVGFAYALVLAELNPAHSREIMRRGEEFGRSRVVCDEEWLSDVEAGRSLAEATLRHIEDKPGFRADFDAAKGEVAAALQSGVKPPNCPGEALALASR